MTGARGAGTWPTLDLLAHRRAATPDRLAVVDAETGERWTYREFDLVVDSVTAALGAGGPVGVLFGTRVAFGAVVHAAMRRGRTVVPLNPELPDATLADQAARAGVDTLVCAAGTERRARDLSGAVGPAEFGCEPGSTPEIEVASVDSSDGVVRCLFDRDDSDERVEPVARPPDQTAVVMFTSGSTGEPKGVRLTVGNFAASAVASAVRLGVTPDDRYLCCLPMYHMGGFATILRAALYGTTLVVQPSFDAGGTADVVAERSITGVSLVPTQLRRLLDAGWSPPAHLRTVLVGGAPTPPELVERCEAADVPIYPTYGTTETASQITTARPAAAFEHPDTVGQPLLFTDVTVLCDGEPAATGESGEIVVDGPTVTPGYLDSERTVAATGDFGLHTGDLGYRDEDGRFWVEGRLDDAITTGGETVHPAAVVARLREHTGIEEAAVVGLPDDEWGERVGALVVASGSLDAETVREFARDGLASYATPKTVEFAGSIPRTASGTVDREAVRERLR